MFWLWNHWNIQIEKTQVNGSFWSLGPVYNMNENLSLLLFEIIL